MSALKGVVLRLRRLGSRMFSGYKKTDIAARHVAYEPIHFHSSSKFGASRVSDDSNGRDSQSCHLPSNRLCWSVLSLPCTNTSIRLLAQETAAGAEVRAPPRDSQSCH